MEFTAVWLSRVKLIFITYIVPPRAPVMFAPLARAGANMQIRLSAYAALGCIVISIPRRCVCAACVYINKKGVKRIFRVVPHAEACDYRPTSPEHQKHGRVRAFRVIKFDASRNRFH